MKNENFRENKKIFPLKKSPSAPPLLTQSKEIFSPLRLEEKTSPPESLLGLYRTLDDNPLTAELPDPEEADVLKVRYQRLVDVSNNWLEDFFDLARLTIQECSSNDKIEEALARLPVYLGPKLYKFKLNNRELYIISQFEKWKETARFQLWSWLDKGVTDKLTEEEHKIKQGGPTWFSPILPLQKPHVLEDPKLRHDFLQNLMIRVIPVWRKEMQRSYEQQQIDTLAMNLIYMGHNNETIKQLVKFPLSSQFAEFIDEVAKDFSRCDCVEKFSNTGEIQELATEIKLIKADCQKATSVFDIHVNDDKCVMVQKVALTDYKTKAIAFIKSELKDEKKAHYYKNKSAESFVEELLTCLNMNDEQLNEEDFIPPLAVLTKPSSLPKVGEQSLIDIAIQRCNDLAGSRIQESFFRVIELLYEYGAIHEQAFGMKNKVRLSVNPIYNLKLEWKLVLLQLANIAIYNQFQAAMKKTLIKYGENIPHLFEASCLVSAFHDWHGLKRSPQRLSDVQELAYSLFKSSNQSFNDHKIYSTFMNLQDRQDSRLRVDISHLYEMIRRDVLKPTFDKCFSFFGEMTIDSRRGIIMTATKYIPLRMKIMELQDENHQLNNDLQAAISELDQLRSQLEKELESSTKRGWFSGDVFYTATESSIRSRSLRPASQTRQSSLSAGTRASMSSSAYHAHGSFSIKEEVEPSKTRIERLHTTPLSPDYNRGRGDSSDEDVEPDQQSHRRSFEEEDLAKALQSHIDTSFKIAEVDSQALYRTFPASRISSDSKEVSQEGDILKDTPSSEKLEISHRGSPRFLNQTKKSPIYQSESHQSLP